MRKVHLDTDLGGDIDDLCALAMVLNWPAIELAGVTTVSDDGGRRLVMYALRSRQRGEEIWFCANTEDQLEIGNFDRGGFPCKRLS